MGHHKRRKRRRGGIKGCGLCKPWKTAGCRNVASNQRQAIKEARESELEQLSELLKGTGR